MYSIYYSTGTDICLYICVYINIHIFKCKYYEDFLIRQIQETPYKWGNKSAIMGVGLSLASRVCVLALVLLLLVLLCTRIYVRWAFSLRTYCSLYCDKRNRTSSAYREITARFALASYRTSILRHCRIHFHTAIEL